MKILKIQKQIIFFIVIFFITTMRPIWIGPDLPYRIKNSDKFRTEGAKPANKRNSLCSVSFITNTAFAENSTMKIGVLAKREPHICMEKWSLTAEYLTSIIPEKTFKIVPIDYKRIISMVEKSKVDFIIVNPLLYVELESRYGVSRIATLKNKVHGGIYTTRYGSVIFCRKNRKNIRHLIDLKGRTFMAVQENAFGGWVMAWRELMETGLNPYKDFAHLSFGGNQDAVVYAVRDGKVDAGAVRTDTLERMDAEGSIRIDEFRIIHENKGENFPFLCSTRLYPEWTIATLNHTSDETVEKVAVALLSMPRNSAAAQSAKCAGWSIPLNYQSVHDCMKELKIGPYKNMGQIKLAQVVRKYWIFILIDIVAFVLVSWLLAVKTSADKKFKKLYNELCTEINKKIQTEKALQKSESRQRDLYSMIRMMCDNLPNFMWVKDLERKFIFVNKACYEEMLFAENSSEPIGKTHEYFINREKKSHPELSEYHTFGDTCFDSDKTILKTKKPQRFEEAGTIRGKKFYFTVYKAPFFDDNGNMIGIIGNVRDITKEKKMEKEKIEMQARLHQAQKMEAIGTLAGGIAHDFNNILSPIMGSTELLLMDIPEDSPFRENLDRIYTGAIRARDLVKQILTFARQNKTDQLILMKVQPVLKEALKFIRSAIPATINIKQDIRTDCGAIKADPTQIYQVIINLATNAYHAMEDTGGELKVIFEEIELKSSDMINFDMDFDIKPGRYALLTVADTGVGMDNELIKKIFTPFFTTKEKGKGTGIGLSIVYGIVKSAGGAVRVTSCIDKGTEFNVFFPIVENPSEKQNFQNQKQKQIQGGTEHILLVDDEENIIKMEKKMLENFLGYKVTSYTSSLEALEVFRTTPDKFDLIITDMAMPDMSGDKLSAELIKIRPDIPILICTGFNETISKDKMASLGISDFLLKPVLMKDFAGKIRVILDKNKN